jgi:hypothetical protein
MVIPYAGDQPKRQDSLNYYLFSLRILVEQVLSVIFGRFGMRCSPTRCSLVKAARIIVVCGKLHNFVHEERVRREAANIDPALTMLSKVLGPASVCGPVLAYSPPLAPSPIAPTPLAPAAPVPLPLSPPPLVPPPLGPSSLPPWLPLPAPTKPAPSKPDITEGARQGDDGRQAQERLPGPCTCALQKLSRLLEHCKAEPPLDHVDQLDHVRVIGISPIVF